MNRNMVNIIESVRGNIPTRYNMTYEEILYLKNIAMQGPNGMFKALEMTFKFGYAIGQRVAKKNK